MKDSDKNRDPERALKRVRSDMRCAMRKMGLLAKWEVYLELPKDAYAERRDYALEFMEAMLEAGI